MKTNGSKWTSWTEWLDPHREYREMCALSVGREASSETHRRLHEHLAQCGPCRRLKQEYEEVMKEILSPEDGGALLGGQQIPRSHSWSLGDAEARLMKTIRQSPLSISVLWGAISDREGLPFFRSFAYVALIISMFCVYRLGVRQGRSSSKNVMQRSSLSAPVIMPSYPSAESMEDRASTRRQSFERGKSELAALRDEASRLRNRIWEQSARLNRTQAEREELNEELQAVQSAAQEMEARLSVASVHSGADAAELKSLRIKVAELTSIDEAKDQQIAKEQELLRRDRDIRDLISARKLYIAEIYDVDKSAKTEEPFGRIFYTKDKSLIFYGYDLDGGRHATREVSFQAWGRKESDRKHDVSLGLLYQDSNQASQKCWVLRFDDATTISELDAVFITVEPEGGSRKPTSKPLLFAYLHVEPNHP